ncbi:hypothetical protein NAS2_0366 [Conexivisphaera calida]|uniref:VapC9 PIN-like domain-containing protein n=1 Tax=Conexivisphaera calida TaxID=1874277 RepID=A0A4P2VC89_9ARCH|nr:hypothetical protein NAS2_0366 [Conexivisphaera calida]
MPDTSFLVQLAGPGGRATMEGLERELGRPRFIVPSCVLNELMALSRSLPEADLALEFARGMEVVDAEGRPDDVVLDVASAVGGIVAAMDKGILREARRRGLATLTLHGGMPVISGSGGTRRARGFSASQPHRIY